MRRFLFALTLLICAAGVLLFAVRPVRAQSASPYDLINTVNEMRSSYGLSPYQIDGSLMSIAQGHSEYMASIGSFTHTRADGTTPKDLNITAENIGGGLNASPGYIVYTQWSDDLHTNTIIGYTDGLVGAGVATTADGVVYYTLDVKNTGKVNNYRQTQPAGASSDVSTTSQPTQLPITPMQAVTPAEDGSITHVVQSGQTLWNIAITYDVKILDLVGLNPGLSAEKPVVYPGQKIIIRMPFTPTISPTITETPIPPTRTSQPTYTPRPTRTITATVTVTSPPLLPKVPSLGSGDAQAIGVVVIIASTLGLLAILISSIHSARKPGE